MHARPCVKFRVETCASECILRGQNALSGHNRVVGHMAVRSMPQAAVHHEIMDPNTLRKRQHLSTFRARGSRPLRTPHFFATILPSFSEHKTLQLDKEIIILDHFLLNPQLRIASMSAKADNSPTNMNSGGTERRLVSCTTLSLSRHLATMVLLNPSATPCHPSTPSLFSGSPSFSLLPSMTCSLRLPAFHTPISTAID